MTTIKNKSELKNLDDQWVMVEAEGMVYERYEGVYYAKVYFKRDDLERMFKTPVKVINYTLSRIGLPEAKRYGRIALSLRQIRQIERVL